MLSSYIRFHVGIGWTSVAFGAIAILLKFTDVIPIPIPKRLNYFKRFHSVFGGGFVTLAMFMPLTANWIWPRFGTPLEIIYLIASLYIGIVVGIIAIRVFKYINQDLFAKSILDEKTKLEEKPTEIEMYDDSPTKDKIFRTIKKHWNPYGDRHIWIKFVHGVVMIFAWVLMLGAGQAFLENSRINGFPYEKGAVTDSLYGRCYARNLTDDSAPSWLTSLNCGLGAACAESSEGGVNPFY